MFVRVLCILENGPAESDEYTATTVDAVQALAGSYQELHGGYGMII
jgi:hypothetical protein